MTLTGLEATLVAGAIASFTAVLTRTISCKWYVTKNECSANRANCALTDLSSNIRDLCNMQRRHGRMLRVLMEKQGIPVEEQLRLEGETLPDGA